MRSRRRAPGTVLARSRSIPVVSVHPPERGQRVLARVQSTNGVLRRAGGKTAKCSSGRSGSPCRSPATRTTTPRIMPPICICRATPASPASRAACGSRRAILYPNTMIVWAMNGPKPLPNIHGGPVRLIVPGWSGSASLAEMADAHHHPRQGDGPGMTEFSYRVGDQADGARGQGRSGEFPDPGIDAGALHHHQSGQRRQVRRRHQGAETARRLLGRRSHRQAGGYLDRFRRHWQGATLEKPKNKYDWQRWTAT